MRTAPRRPVARRARPRSRATGRRRSCALPRAEGHATRAADRRPHRARRGRSGRKRRVGGSRRIPPQAVRAARADRRRRAASQGAASAARTCARVAAGLGGGQTQLLARDLRSLLEIERGQRLLLQRAYRQTVTALAAALESKDTSTEAHSKRVQRYAFLLAAAVDPLLIDDPSVEYGFLLHDVGKIGIPDHILQKPGPLTASERRLMETHTVLGEQLLADVEILHGSGIKVVRSHHERWDGGGYPDGLAGTRDPARRARLRRRRHARRDHEQPPVQADRAPGAKRSARSSGTRARSSTRRSSRRSPAASRHCARSTRCSPPRDRARDRGSFRGARPCRDPRSPPGRARARRSSRPDRREAAASRMPSRRAAVVYVGIGEVFAARGVRHVDVVLERARRA